jgi:hypothetical protein
MKYQIADKVQALTTDLGTSNTQRLSHFEFKIIVNFLWNIEDEGITPLRNVGNRLPSEQRHIQEESNL